MKLPAIWTSVFCGLTLGVALLPAAAPPTPDEAFRKFWDARTPQDAGKAGQDVVSSGVTFDDALARLKRGRVFPASAKRGGACRGFSAPSA